MKNKHETPLYKRPWCLLLLLVLFVGAALLTIHFLNTPTPNSVSTTPSPSSTKKPEETDLDSLPDDLSDSDEIDSSSELAPEEATTTDKTPEQYSGDDANSYTSLTGSVTYAAVSGEKLMIRVNIDQYLSSGTCELTLTGSGATVTSLTNIVPEASTSSCEGFDVPLADLPPSGLLNIRIALTSGDRSGVINSEVSL